MTKSQASIAEIYKISKPDNHNFPNDGKEEMESTAQLTLQQNSALEDKDSPGESITTASASILSSSLQTPKTTSSVQFKYCRDFTEDEDSNVSIRPESNPYLLVQVEIFDF